MMNKKCLSLLFCLYPVSLFAQVGPVTGEAQLRLHPVWERVADVFGEAGSVESAEFSPDGRYIVSGTKFDNSIIMWRTSDGTEQWRAYAAEEVERVGFSPDGKYVASCSEDYLVTVYEAETGREVLKLKQERAVDGLSYGNKKNILIAGQEKMVEEKGGKTITHGYVTAYDMPSGKALYKVDHGGTVNEIQFTQDDEYFLSAGTNSEVKVWNTNTGELVKTLHPGREFKFVCANFSPDGKYIAASGFEGDIFVWEWEKGALIRDFNTSGRKVETITFTPDAQYLLTAGNDPYIRVYRAVQVLDKGIKKVPIAYAVHANDQAEYMDFNADGSFLVSAHQDGIIRLWVFMGEDPILNQRRHREVSAKQTDAKKKGL